MFVFIPQVTQNHITYKDSSATKFEKLISHKDISALRFPAQVWCEAFAFLLACGCWSRLDHGWYVLRSNQLKISDCTVFVWGKFHGFWNAPEVIGPPKRKLDRIGSRSFENADCRSQQFDLRQRKNWVSARKLSVLSHRGLALEPSKKHMR